MTERLSIRTTCRVCGESELPVVLDLGELPLANALLRDATAESEEARFPLTLVFCPVCSLLQIRETVSPDVLFENYPYFSSCSTTMLAHAKESAQRLIEQRDLDERSLVVEVASNDGYMLRNFVDAGVPVVGFEPAENVASVASELGVTTRCEFFGEDPARRLREERGTAAVLIGNNVLAHVPDLDDFVRGVRVLLAQEGVAEFEFPYVADLVANSEFDAIYHEHLNYFSLTSVERLFARHGMAVLDVERVPIHGGSLRVRVGHRDQAAEPAVARMLAEEVEVGLTGFDYYSELALRFGRVRDELCALLEHLRQQGKSVAAYGASAKGSTLMNCLGIDRRHLDFVADRSPHKQGQFTPGNHLPIESPSELERRRPDYVLLLTWNFAAEIFEQQAAYRAGGGKFIVPIPEVRIA